LCAGYRFSMYDRSAVSTVVHNHMLPKVTRLPTKRHGIRLLSGVKIIMAAVRD
jgi:hypothetical protein